MKRIKTRQADLFPREERPGLHIREMRLEVLAPCTRADGLPDERIAVALSSETPVERVDWWTGERYLEVLDHSPGGVNMTAVGDGIPFLKDHDLRAQIGLIEDLRLDSDRKLRGFVRMGNHPDAEWMEEDIRAGIRSRISVGYDPGESYTVTQADDDKVPTRTYRGWTPREGSSVAVPADMAVGVGRNAQPVAPSPTLPANARKGEEIGMAEKDTPAVAPVGLSALEQKERDLAALGELAEHFPEAKELFASWVKRGVSPTQALKELQEKQMETVRAQAAKTPSGVVDMPASDQRRYSIVRAIDAAIQGRTGASADPWREAGLELEVSNTLAKQLGRSPTGFFIPNDAPIQLRASVTGNIAATASLGGAGVQTTIIGYIDLLRNRMQVANAGATFLPGLTDTVQFTRALTANTANWVGENPSTANALTSNTMETVTLSPKVLMSSTAFSRRLLSQFSFDVNAMVMNDLTTVNAIAIDLAALVGTGASNQPLGIRSQTGVTLITVGANGAAATWDNVVSAETNVADNNGDIGTMSWLVSPKVRGKWKTTLKSTTAGSFYLYADDGTVNGYRSFVTKQIPDNTTQGTGTTICSTPIFGVWDQLLIGQWGATDVIVDPYTYSQQNMIQVVTSVMVDVNVRQPKSFAVLLGVTTT